MNSNIYILDMPDIFHQEPHSPVEQRKCQEPLIKTFVDDGYTLGENKYEETFEEAIEKTMVRIQEYMSANLLALNEDK